MEINLAAAPYYDDFDKDKNFYRILFKPGVPVQARELTQLQSILQDQIRKFGNHVFNDGSRALKDSPVSVTVNRNVKAVKLQPSATIFPIESYLGKYVTSTSSSLIGKVIFVFDANNPTIGDPQTLIINVVSPDGDNNEFISESTLYFFDTLEECVNISGLTSNLYATTAKDITITGTVTSEIFSNEITLNSITGTLLPGDYVTGITGIPSNLYIVKVISNTRVLLNSNFGIAAISQGITFLRKNTSSTLVVGISSGAYYKNGTFIQVPYQSVVVQKYTPFPHKSVILKYQESLVGYNDDSSLLDPAFGSSNYLGPGADRLKIELILDTVDLDSNNKPNYTDKYIEVIRFTNGNEDLIESATDNSYAELGSILADRTYSESGNYIIEPFKVTPAGSASDGINNKFYVSKGKGVIGGYDISTIDKTEIVVPKSRDYITTESLTVGTTFGPYILIEAPKYSLPDELTPTFYDTYECHSTANTLAMGSSTLVGYVLNKHIQYDSGTGANAAYRFYWDFYTHYSATKKPTDIKALIGKTNWFSVQYNNTGSNTSPTFLANVSARAGFAANATGVNEMQIFDSEKISRLVFPIGASYVKDVRRNNTTYTKVYKNVPISAGVAIVTTTVPNQFVGYAGEISDALKRQYYMGVLKANTGIDGANIHYGSTPLWKISSNVFVPLESVYMGVTNQGTTLTINFGNTSVNSSMDLLTTIYTDSLQRKTKTLVSNYTRRANITTVGHPDGFSLFKSDIYDVKGIFKIGSNTFVGDYSSSVSYTANSLVQSNGKIYRAAVDNTGIPLSNTYSWNKVNGESLLLYYINNGQQDNAYDHGSIKYLGSADTLPGNVLVVFDYFTHSAGGYFDAKSYPADMYSKIPTYRSPKDSKEFNLRDCLDYRTRRADDTGYYLTNPFESYGRSDIYTFDSWYKPVADTTTGTQIDIDNYVGRIDRLYVQNRDASQTGRFYLDKGTPALNPVPNKDISDKNTELIATLVNAPYTASSSDVNIVHNNSPRYTMKDISLLDNKIKNIEKRVKKQGIEILSLSNTIFDRTGSNVLYKTGIFVEDFSSLNAGDVLNPHFTVAINTKLKECRPAFSANWHNLFFISDPDVSLADNFVTMNYTEETYIDVASASTNTPLKVNGNGISTDSGSAVNHDPYIIGTAAGVAAAYYFEGGALAETLGLTALLGPELAIAVAAATAVEATTHIVESAVKGVEDLGNSIGLGGLGALNPFKW